MLITSYDTSPFALVEVSTVTVDKNIREFISSKLIFV